jgi:hypothetical protein
VRQRAVAPVREHLLDLGVVAVLLLGPKQGEWGVGEDQVVSPGGKSSACPAAAWVFRSRTRRTISRAVIPELAHDWGSMRSTLC